MKIGSHGGREDAYANFEKVATDIDAFDHVKEIRLEDERIAVMMQFLEVIQALSDRALQLHQQVLHHRAQMKSFYQSLCANQW